MCPMTFARVSASSLPSMNAASVSSEGKPVCSIAVTFSIAFGRPHGVQRLRVTEVRFSLATRKRERELVIGVVEQLAGVMAVHAGIFQRELQLRQQLIDPLVQSLVVEFQRACDFGDRSRIPKAHPQNHL